MSTPDLLTSTCSNLTDVTGRLAGLCRSLPTSETRIPNSTWSVREAVVHCVFMADLYVEIATGTPGPIADFSVETVARRNAERNADNPESDPGKLADLLEGTVERLVATIGARGPEERVRYTEFDPAELGMSDLGGIIIGEFLLHGFDVATAVGAPWPIPTGEALMVLGSYAPMFGLCANPDATAGHTAGYGIEMRGGPAFTMRFTDGVYSHEPPGAGPIECTISADPVAFLMVASGRLDMWTAIALGLLGAGGDRPELALGFTSLFVYP